MAVLSATEGQGAFIKYLGFQTNKSLPNHFHSASHQRGQWASKVSCTISILAFFSLGSKAKPAGSQGTPLFAKQHSCTSPTSILQHGALSPCPRKVQVIIARQESRPWSPSFFSAQGSCSLWILLLFGAFISATIRLWDGIWIARRGNKLYSRTGP